MRTIHWAVSCMALSLGLITRAGTNGSPAPGGREFARPDRIRYDGQCLTIEGKDLFLYSGAFHYFRCPEALWRDRFQKIKEAGFNAVETYVPWNWHETQMPADPRDFSKVRLRELDDWLKMAEEFGFYIIIRPGPYICAEWDTGGFPRWLLTKRPEHPLRKEGWLRSDDPAFLTWSRHWYDAVCPVIARHQITHKKPGQPGIILFQIENEYDYSPHFSDEAKLNHLRALAQEARANGIDVPLFTCWTRQARGQADPLMGEIFDSCNFYPRWNVEGELGQKLQALRAEQSGAPLMTTELQGGWFSKVGGKLSEEQDGITAEQINNLTLYAIQSGVTLINYYMLFGGTNPDGFAARDMTTSYDYNAPIREWGGVGDRYDRVKAIGEMLREHGVRLARALPIACETTGTQADVGVAMRKAVDGSRYIFVWSSQRAEGRQGRATVREETGSMRIAFDYNLEPFGSKVLYLPSGVTNAALGEWLPRRASPMKRPTECPAPVLIPSGRYKSDPGPARWTPMKLGQPLDDLGIYDNRLVFYRMGIGGFTETNLIVEYREGDGLLASDNGQSVNRSGGATNCSWYPLGAGSNEVRLLYENLGNPNGGSGMEKQAGISSARITALASAPGAPIVGWRMREVSDAAQREEVKPDFNDADWKPVNVSKLEARNLPPDRTAVYRASVQLTEPELRNRKWALSFGRIDDLGWVFVNGAEAGQTTDWSRSYSFEVTEHLRAGSNLVAVVVHNNGGDGGLGSPRLEPVVEGAPVTSVSFGNPAGFEQQWWRGSLNDRGWDTIEIGPETPPDHAPLNWYRFNFKLPSPKRGVWTPWKLRLEANGNGFLFLNGHALGRYWEAGPQHDFFLPECWLNLGPRKPNILTLCLRPLEKGALVQRAQIEPYSEFAETR